MASRTRAVKRMKTELWKHVSQTPTSPPAGSKSQLAQPISSNIVAILCFGFNAQEMKATSDTSLEDILHNVNLRWFVTWLCTERGQSESDSETAENIIRAQLRHFLTSVDQQSINTAIPQLVDSVVHLYLFWWNIKKSGLPIERVYRQFHNIPTPRPSTQPSFNLGALTDVFALKRGTDGTIETFPFREEVEGWPFTNSTVACCMWANICGPRHPDRVVEPLKYLYQHLTEHECQFLFGKTDFWLVVCPEMVDSRYNHKQPQFLDKPSSAGAVSAVLLTYDADDREDAMHYDQQSNDQLKFNVGKEMHRLGEDRKKQRPFGYPMNQVALDCFARFYTLEKTAEEARADIHRLQMEGRHRDLMEEHFKAQWLAYTNDNDIIRLAFINCGSILVGYPKAAKKSWRSGKAVIENLFTKADKERRDVQAHSSNFRQDVGVVQRRSNYVKAFEVLYGVTLDDAVLLCPDMAADASALPAIQRHIHADDKNLLYATLNSYAWLQSIAAGSKWLKFPRRHTNGPATMKQFPAKLLKGFADAVRAGNIKYELSQHECPLDLPSFADFIVEAVVAFVQTLKPQGPVAPPIGEPSQPSRDGILAEGQLPEPPSRLTAAAYRQMMVFNEATHDCIHRNVCDEKDNSQKAGPGCAEWMQVSRKIVSKPD